MFALLFSRIYLRKAISYIDDGLLQDRFLHKQDGRFLFSISNTSWLFYSLLYFVTDKVVYITAMFSNVF